MRVPRKFQVNPSEEDEMAEVAQALLDAVRHVLTGMEIDMLEKIASMLEPDWNEFYLSTEQIEWFYSLQTQFALEVAKWHQNN
jgi:hypothetical protein